MPFEDASRINKKPVVHRLLADLETPLSAYWKLAHDEPNSFLLESVSGGEQVARYSMIGVRPCGVLTAFGDKSLLNGKPLSIGTDPLAELRKLLPQIDPEFDVTGLPKYLGGAVGMICYDYVRQIEDIPATNPDQLGLPDVAMMICDSVVVFDHARAEILIIALAEPTDEGQKMAEAEINRIESRLRMPLPPMPTGNYESHPVKSNMESGQFEGIVERVRDYIAAGDCIQVVASQRFTQKVDAHPVTVYRALRGLNPSPYMFLLRFEEFDIVGASPELLVGLEGREAMVKPIAGTRPRGANHLEDEILAKELLADQKERAEHIMLVDLGRNDIGRVASPGTVKVEKLMQIEMYSHVMHIVSDVVGELRPELDGIDLIRATFPAGTLSGAQKVRAMEIIEELENTKRGLYGGAVGTISANGDVNLAIAIRTILMKDGMAHVQAGAGLVYDSVPATENEECHNKARAALLAIEKAQAGIGF
ncbi:MAG: anthranilate synthase component I [Fimbriimonadaceae bacterium]|nr:MAG: anthranilate synthase component I [Fimbriimonadaceae bacterium]